MFNIKTSKTLINSKATSTLLSPNNKTSNTLNEQKQKKPPKPLTSKFEPCLTEMVSPRERKKWNAPASKTSSKGPIQL